jgi:hypothetical protein
MPAVSPLVAIFRDSYPELFLEQTAGTLSHAYAAADRFARRFEWPEGHDIRRLVQRVFFEGPWRALARRHDLMAEAMPNAIANCFHTYVQAGPVSLTASFVDSPSALVRRAVFRSGYAARTQGDLFLPDEAPPPVTSLYSILLHGAARREPALPAFMHVRFPVPDCRSYFDGVVDLGRLFPNAAATVDPTPEEEIEESFEIALRQGLAKKEQRGA